MGGGSWTDKDWAAYSARRIDTAKTVDDIFTASRLDPALDPKGVTLRESRDSAEHPNSNAIAIGLDESGSMSMVLEQMAREGLKTLAEQIYERKPVTDPQIMMAGIGDADHNDDGGGGDAAPLQPTQFESDIRIATGLEKIWLERNGGGNDHESYILFWLFLALHSRLDCFEKRGQKGMLVTIGDECPTPYLMAKSIERVLGTRPQANKITAKEVLTMVSRQYDVYHLIVEEGSFCKHSHDRVVREWTELLGQRAIRLADHTKMGEVIISLLQARAGVDTDTIVKSWDGKTAITVKRAIGGLSKVDTNTNGLVKL